MKLYTFFRSSASFRVRIALNHKALKYEPAIVSLPKGEHLEAGYKSLNAQGLVPALEDGGRLLTQSLAIIEYLDEVHPGPKLLPVAPLDRAYVRAFSQIIACEIHPLNNLRTRKYIAKTYKLDEEGVNTWYRHWIAEGFQMMEAFLAQEREHGKYCFRDQVTMADCCLVPQVFNARRFAVDLAPYPRIVGIAAACGELPAFQGAAPDRQIQ